jgi:hypothetical protein
VLCQTWDGTEVNWRREKSTETILSGRGSIFGGFGFVCFACLADAFQCARTQRERERDMRHARQAR